MKILASMQTAHESYVAAYNYIGRLTQVAWVAVSHLPIWSAPRQWLAGRTQVLHDTGIAAASRAIQLSNQLLERPINETVMRDCTPEVKKLLRAAQVQLMQLSQSCSLAFGKTVIFPKILSREEGEVIMAKLSQLSSSAAQQRAFVACRHLSEIRSQIEEEQGKDISAADFEAFQNALAQNILLSAAVAGTVENIGEVVGDLLISEESPVFAQSWNPAIVAGKKVAEVVGKPLGRIVGSTMQLAGIYYLLSKLPLMQMPKRRKAIQAAAILTFFAAEYAAVNPLTNYLAEVSGGIFYDFGFYAIALLFNYIGMYMAGTEETLESYVRNMTPATLTQRGASIALKAIGVEGFVASGLSFYLSHVAYNFKIYQALVMGRFGETLFGFNALDLAQEHQQLKCAQNALVQAGASRLSSSSLEKIEYQLDTLTEAITREVGAILPQSLPAAFSLSALIANHRVKRAVQELESELIRFGVQEGRELQLYPSSAPSQLRELKKNGICLGLFFLVQEVNAFFRAFSQPRVQHLFEQYKAGCLHSMEQSYPENLDSREASNISLETVRTQLWQELERIALQTEEESGHFSFSVSSAANSGNALLLGDIYAPLKAQLEHFIYDQLEHFYPLVPRFSSQEMIGSICIVDLVARSLAFFSSIRVLSGQSDLAQGSELPLGEYAEFARHMLDLTLTTIRFASRSRVASTWMRGVNRVAQGQTAVD